MEKQEIKNYLKMPAFFVSISAGLISALLVFILVTIFLGGQPSTVTENKPRSFNLSVSSPGENLAVGQKQIKIQGSTGIDTIVTVNSGTEAKTLETNNTQFSTEITLKEGRNVIDIVAFDPKTGESQTTSREVLYLEEDLTNL